MTRSSAACLIAAALISLALPVRADSPLIIGDGKDTTPANPSTTQPNIVNIGQRPGAVIGPGGPIAVNPGGRIAVFDPEKARLAALDEIKTALDVTDDQWKVLQPKIETVQKLLPAPTNRFGRPGFQPGNNVRPMTAVPLPGGAPAAQPADPAAEKLADLRSTLDDKDSTPDQIKQKVDALRETRTKAKEELAKAQKDLRESLTPRQEALLIARNLLD